MVELSEACQGVVNALIAAPVAWLSPAELADALGRGVQETTDLLCDLDLAGWLAVWDGESGPVVTLSPLGAERMGVRLVEEGFDVTPRWAQVGDPEPHAPRSTNLCASARSATLAFVPDPAPEPGEAAARGERAAVVAARVVLKTTGGEPEARAAKLPRADDLPHPSVLLGVGLTPWPGPGQEIDQDATCPACGSRRLRSHMYCLYCDRWGLDHLTSSLPESPSPVRPRGASEASAIVERLQEERLRERRRAKRLKNHQARVEALRNRRQGKTATRDTKPPGASSPGQCAAS